MYASPLVTIIISAYNAEKYLSETLESVLNQSYPNIEIIVVNDGSTDKTLAIAESYAGRSVSVLSQENRGQDAALNSGYKNAHGKYIKFLDSDDLINPEMIARQVRVLNGSDEFLAYGEWARFTDCEPGRADFAKLDYWKDMSALDFLTARPEGVMLQCGIMLIPRNLIEKAGLWDERLILFNDTEFFTRILLQSKGVKFSEGARLFYRSGLASSISSQRSRKYFESTLLASDLIAKHLLVVEDSSRVRRLISNTYLMQYHQLYPNCPDLIKQLEEKIRFYGHGTLKIDGGMGFKVASRIFGWKGAKKLQNVCYKMGYLRVLYKVGRVSIFLLPLKNRRATL